jgi:ferredoxin
MYQIRLEPVGSTVTVPPGSLLLPALLGKDLNVAMSCGGNGICSTCHVKVRAGMDDLSAATAKERRTLALVADADATSRLACQAAVLGDGVVLDLPRGMYVEAVDDLLGLLGDRAPENILHPIRGHVLIPRGKIVTRTLLEQSRSLDDEVRRMKDGLAGVRPAAEPPAFAASGSGRAPPPGGRPVPPAARPAPAPPPAPRPAPAPPPARAAAPGVRVVISASATVETPTAVTDTPRPNAATPRPARPALRVEKPESTAAVTVEPLVLSQTPTNITLGSRTERIPAAETRRPRAADRPARTPTTGDLVGKCLLLDCVGSGGLGVVYRALHTTLNVPVAVKFLRETDAGPVLDRFRTEARLLAKMTHPNVIRVLDFEDDPACPYVVMEYAEGLSLHDLLAQAGRLSPDRAVAAVLGAVDGLDAAWQVGIVHRDVKPANILVARDGTVKLVDLGLAARVRTEAGDRSAPAASGTQVDGTLAYLCPDRARNPAGADHRADIYALGVTLYQLLTGRLPFTGSTGYEILAAHACDPVPDREVVAPDVPPGVFAVARRMMAKRPDDRYQTYTGLREALLECREK